MISALATTPPSASPFPTPLAKVMMSGVMPCAWYPQKCSPVRPHPVCTSSLMNKMPCSSRTSLKAPKNPSGGRAKPPTPWIGSAMKQATSPEVIMSITWRRSSTQAAVNASSSRWPKGLRSR